GGRSGFLEAGPPLALDASWIELRSGMQTAMRSLATQDTNPATTPTASCGFRPVSKRGRLENGAWRPDAVQARDGCGCVSVTLLSIRPCTSNRQCEHALG